MKRLLPIAAAALCMSVAAFAEEPDEAAEDTAAADEAPAEKTGDGIESPKAMSGMSILGNEEAPKSLVIVPWKSSELGDNISLSDTLDDRARPVDKEVFLRQLHFYEIRSGTAPDQG
jgi:hypothetical protein